MCECVWTGSSLLRAFVCGWLALFLSCTPFVIVSLSHPCPYLRVSLPQENFELNHETLYLAVKLTDHYLAAVPCNKDLLQLVGSTAMLIASKFEVSLASH